MTTKFISDMGPKSALIAPRPLKFVRKTGGMVEWLERLGYGAESCPKARV